MAEYLIKEETLKSIADAIKLKTNRTDAILVSDLANEITDISIGVELNFEVIGGSSAPSNPAENTIWVNTDTTITRYQFSTEYQGKNLLKNTATSQTINGVTFTVNADGSVTANGTASENTWLEIVVYLEPNTTYTVSGCPKDGSYETYCVQLMDTTDWVSVSEYGNGANFTTSGVARHEFRMRIGANATVSNITFYPMIRLASETDVAWEPYGGAKEGFVWISTGDNGQIEFDALKENSIPISPLSVKQYINGVWVSKDAQMYQSDTWKKFFEPVYIMKDGVMTSSSYTWSGGTGTFKTTTYNGVSVYQTGVYNSTDPTTSTLSNILVPAGARTFCVSYYELASYGTNPSFTIGSCSASVDRQGSLRIQTPGTVRIDVTSIAGAETTVQFKYKTAGCADNGTNYFGSMWFE